MDKRMISIAAVVAAATLWGTIGVFTRELEVRGLTAMQVTEVRCIVIVVTLLIILGIFKREYLKINLKDIWMFFGTGVLGIVTFNVLYFEEINIGCPLSMVAVLLYTAPLFVLVMSYFIFKEDMPGGKIVAAIIAFVGCALTAGILGSSGDFNVQGFLMGIGSGFGYALYTIFSKFAMKKYHPATLTFYTFLLAGLFVLPFSDLPGLANITFTSSDAWMWMLGLGILISLIPYFLYNYGLRGLDAGVASVIAFIEPMVATISGFLMYGQVPTLENIIGIALVLAGVIMLNIDFRRIQRNRARPKAE